MLCDEQRRQCFAEELLRHLGEEARLQGAAPSERRARDGVDEKLIELLGQRQADGSLAREVKIWGLDSTGILDELVVLATAAPQDTQTSPVLSPKTTPLLYEKFIRMLFVGLAHNLPLEADVSKVARVEKSHPRADPQLLRHIFLYTARREGDHAERLSRGMRSDVRGGAREAARDKIEEHGGKLTSQAATNRKQLTKLCEQVHARTIVLTEERDKLYRRGHFNLVKRLREARARHKLEGICKARKKVNSLVKTCMKTPTGRLRRPPLAPLACLHLLPPKDAKSDRGCAAHALPCPFPPSPMTA